MEFVIIRGIKRDRFDSIKAIKQNFKTQVKRKIIANSRLLITKIQISIL